MPKGNENRGNPRNPLPFSACEAGKGNEKRETQQNSMPLPPARSEKGNENRGNPRNPLPLKQVSLPKGNQKRETQQNTLLLSPAKSEKGQQPQKATNQTRQPHLGAAPLFDILSAITADHIFSKSSEFSRMDPTSLRWMNRGSTC